MDGRESTPFIASKEDWTPEEWARAERDTFTVGWNAEDKIFIASAVEIPYAVSHGRTPEEAVHNVVDAVATVLDTADGNPAITVSEPNGIAL